MNVCSEVIFYNLKYALIVIINKISINYHTIEKNQATASQINLI